MSTARACRGCNRRVERLNHRGTARRSRNQTWIPLRAWQAPPPHPPSAPSPPAEKRWGRRTLDVRKARALFGATARLRNLLVTHRNQGLAVFCARHEDLTSRAFSPSAFQLGEKVAKPDEGAVLAAPSPASMFTFRCSSILPTSVRSPKPSSWRCVRRRRCR